MMRWALFVVAMALAVVVRAEPVSTNRPSSWAVPVTKPGLPNLHKINDQLYRSAQPNAEGFRQLKAMGVKTVISLRSFHSDRDEMGDIQLTRERIRFNTWHPEDEDVVRFLKIVANTNSAPVLVHCQHGADRTGLMCAIYRVVIQGWTKEAAINEMTNGGYGYHEVWKNLIEYLNELDVEAIREKAGLSAPKTAQ